MSKFGIPTLHSVALAAEASDKAVTHSTTKGEMDAHSNTDSAFAKDSDEEGVFTHGSSDEDGWYDDGGDDGVGSNDRERDNGDRNDGPSSTGDENSEDDEENESNTTGSDDTDEDSGSDTDDRISNGDDVVSDAGPEQPASYFDFFGLPLELRDMIYDQPQLFETQTMLPSRKGYPFRMAANKPDSSLLLVSKQFSSEYKRRCEGRVELSVADYIDHFAMGTPYGVVTMPLTKEISSMRMHVGDWWMLPSPYFPGLNDSLKKFKDWLSHWIAQMPKLQTVTVSLYPYENLIRLPEYRDMLITKLCDLISLNLLTEVKVIAMEGDRPRFLSIDPRKLLVDWKCQDAVRPQLIDPMADYAETCCSNLFFSPRELSYDPSGGDESSYSGEDDE
jgi:hypothetical protein